LLTVRELITDLDVRLIAGESALDLPIRWVHISELLDPTPWLSGGEVLLTTGMMLDTPERQRAFVDLIADRQLAGLGFGVGFEHERVPEAIVEAAVELDFPVFEVPFELPFIAVTEAAFSKLVNEQYAVLRRALSAQERLERVVLSERGLDALAGTLATLLGAGIVIYDARGEMLVKHAFRRPFGDDEIELLRAGVRDRIVRREHQQFMPELEDPSRALVIPVVADGSGGGAAPAPEAWLIAVKDDTPLSDFDRLALRQAVTIVALELLRERVAGDTERRLAGDLLAGLLAGELSGQDLQRRLEPFGIADQVATVVMTRPNGGTTAHQAEAALMGALRAEATPSLVASDGRLVGALLPGLEDDTLFALAERVAGRLARDLPDEPITLGVGRSVAGGDARRSYHEARCTLESLSVGLNPTDGRSGQRAGTTGSRIATYRDLGSFQLLLSLQDDEALKLFCDSVLGPIEQSEGYYGGELMRSLEAFIEENGQWERAAKRLFCHRHTLRYRIRRVEELTGRNLGSARDRIEFWLALRGRELIA
jgi:PucR family transcriptional regulator, purine catabolism regulatory protein